MANAYLNLALEVLQDADKPLTYQEVWERTKAAGLVDKLRSKGKTPWQSLGAQLYVDVRDNVQSKIVKVGQRPTRFFLKSRQAEVRDDVLVEIEKQQLLKKPASDSVSFRERDLHPVLAYFAYSNPAFNRGRSIYTKTIFHESSRRSGYNEWIHPDIVGFYLPLDDWESEVVKFNRISDNNSVRLYSFELKKSLSKANYREAYFQAVSNSSWAHEGYLVAADILQDDEFLAELERLAASFGIGIVHLDLADVDASGVLYPAKVKDSLDWETINKLCVQNPDFKKFIEDVRIDFESSRIHSAEYDEILKDPEDFIRKHIGKSG